jgi:MSHA biogenesis protein MshN
VEIAGARLGDGVQRTFETGPVRRLRARNERGQAVLVFDLDRPARIETSEPEASSAAPNLIVTLAMSPDSTAPGTPSPLEAVSDAAAGAPDVVTPENPGNMEIQPSRNHRAVDRLYQEAAQLCRDGKLAVGLAKLAEVLAQDPGHVDGRQLLATELMQQGDPRQAAAILDAGLANFPRTWQWAQLRAQIAVNSGETERALAVLSVAPPAVAEQPDYHALLAAVLQRVGRHAEAVNTYHSVLGRKPERGLWWMGLGISLQALERTREAGFAYGRALEDASLTPELRSFVQGRMTSLPQGRDT